MSCCHNSPAMPAKRSEIIIGFPRPASVNPSRKLYKKTSNNRQIDFDHRLCRTLGIGQSFLFFDADNLAIPRCRQMTGFAISQRSETFTTALPESWRWNRKCTGCRIPHSNLTSRGQHHFFLVDSKFNGNCYASAETCSGVSWYPCNAYCVRVELSLQSLQVLSLDICACHPLGQQSCKCCLSHC